MIREVDIAGIVGEHLKSKKSILDVGVGSGKHLYPFLELGFNYLEGIDTNESIKEFAFHEYLIYKNRYQNIMKSETSIIEGKNEPIQLNKDKFNSSYLKSHFPSLEKEFASINFTFNCKEGDFLNFKTNIRFDVIIASQILHFFKPKEQELFLSKVESLLNPKGLLFIAAYSFPKCLNTDFEENKTRIADQVYSKEDGTLFYLLSDNDFIKLLSAYKLVKKIEYKEWNEYCNAFLVQKKIYVTKK